MIVIIKPIIEKCKKQYGYNLTISSNNKVTTKQRLFHTDDFMDITVKSAELQALIEILKLVIKSKPIDVIIYITSNSILNLTHKDVTARSTLSKQFVALYDKCIKNSNITIVTKESKIWECIWQVQYQKNPTT